MAEELNLQEIEAEVEQMTPEQIRESLLEIRTKQRVQQKKYHSTEAAKRYQQKRAAKVKAMTEAAKKLGLYDSIKEEANERADEQLASEEADAQDQDAA